MFQNISCKNYDIALGDWKALNAILDEDYSSRIVIVDEHTEKFCLPLFLDKTSQVFHTIVIPAGEKYKNLITAQYIWSEMLNLGADRHSICVNLGGGVIGDMGGWTAASFMRGMDFIQLPTTLLSMVDASVGGKLGIDFQGVKNIVGMIKDPKGVFIFTEFLNTLNNKLLRSGFAEVIKHGLIQDRLYWDKVINIDLDRYNSWDEVVRESVLIKKAVTEADPYEKGQRKILNFGHTIGHAIESLSFSQKEPLLHGEAIAIGMITEAHLSFQNELIPRKVLEKITAQILKIYDHHPAYIPELNEVLPLMKKDKKNRAGQISFSLISGIGQCLYDQMATDIQVKSSLDYYKSL